MTWKRVLAFAVTQFSAAGLFWLITEDRMPLPVLGYVLLFILGMVGLLLVTE